MGTIVDVRTIEEFEEGRVDGSINIPLHEVPDNVEKFKSMEQPLILCCRSGNRSGQACAYLQAQGIDCENGGSWQEVETSPS